MIDSVAGGGGRGGRGSVCVCVCVWRGACSVEKCSVVCVCV